MLHLVFSHYTAGIIVWLITLVIFAIAYIDGFDWNTGLRTSSLSGRAWVAFVFAMGVGVALIWWW